MPRCVCHHAAVFPFSEKRKGNLVGCVSRRCDHVSVEEMRWIMPRQTWFAASYTLSTISNCQCLAGQSGGRVMMWWVVFLLVGRGAARQAVRSFSFYVVVCWIFYRVNMIKAVLQLSRVEPLLSLVLIMWHCHLNLWLFLNLIFCPAFFNRRTSCRISEVFLFYFFWHCLCPHIIQDLLG